MPVPSTISYEEQVRLAEAYKEYGGFDKAARALRVPRWKIVRSVYRLAGKCDCGKEILPGHATCEICLNRAKSRKNKLYYQRKEQGLCVECGLSRGNSASTVHCEEHRQLGLLMAKYKREKRRELGLCLTCGNPLDSDHQSYCSKHAGTNRKHFVKARSKTKFGGLYEQVLERDGHKCVICGEVNIRLEVHHKVKDKGNTLENLDTLCMKCHHAITYLYNCPNAQGAIDYYYKNPEN
jgi:hypothetical protein